MAPSTSKAPRRVTWKTTKYLRRLVKYCRCKAPFEVPTTGLQYYQLSSKLQAILKMTLKVSGDYTSARIARAVLCAYPPTVGWEQVSIWQLRGISADQNDAIIRYIGKQQAPFDQTATDFAKYIGCKRPELATMWVCLAKQRRRKSKKKCALVGRNS